MSETPPFQRVLVANRGEIARRICRGLRECGVESVVVYSDAHREARHREAGGVAVPLGGETAAESYLQIDKILAACRETGAEAVHPGYGFLSENADFARAVQEAGLVFIGPDPETMDALGKKQAAREIAVAAGVPVVPGCDEEFSADAEWQAKADEIGYPLMVKASAGGGGKGMRMVERSEDLLEALRAGQREAKAAFGDDRMILERRVFPARHIEIQVMGDHHGEVVSFHERECSVQRRHQKVLEEAPSPAVDEDLRQRMGEAAVRLCKHVGYKNAGTVEFLLDPDGDFYFLEVNTRLQVEHPVTECVTGEDLVHLQLQVAAGAKLEDLLRGRDLTPRGHAIEARLYAECPENGYLPAAGTLLRVLEPAGPGIRIDTGVRSGTEVTVHYDPMLAKLIVHAPDRATACRRMLDALNETHYLGLTTNIDFLSRVVADAKFQAGDLRTDFLDLAPELAEGPGDDASDAAFAAAALAELFGADGVSSKTRSEPSSTGSDSVFTELGAMRLWESSASEGGAR
ncbi:MAG: biotin carboxylase N-terminal domain-containing protein [Planctomycetota bacterium]